MRWAALFLVALVVAGCKDAREAQVTDIARLFVSLRLESRAWEGQPERARAGREKVLRDACMTLPEWRRRVATLQSDPDLWKPFWKKVEQFSDSADKLAKKKTQRKGT